jgi:primary-amine oxidase
MERWRWLPNARSIRFLFILFTTILASLGIVLLSSSGLNLTGATALAQTVPAHPLDALTAEEYTLTKNLLTDAGYINADSRFPLITLREPAKAEMLVWQPGESMSRSADVIVKQGAQTYEAVVDLSAGTVQSWKEVAGVQPSLLLGEIIGVTELTISNPDWQAAMQQRGITDFTQIFCAPLATGYYGLPEEEGRRILRVPCYDTRDTKNNLYGKPIEGVLAIVDLNEKQVLEVIDTGMVPISPDPASYDQDSVGQLRPTLKPTLMSQPTGSNITFSNSLINWQKWSFHLRFDRRLGTVVSLVNYDDNGRNRSILYQGTLSEIFVPYMDATATWYYRTYMDSGEYGFGLLSTPLVAGIDCPTTATFISPVLPDDQGNPYTAPNSICVFERSSGDPIWRHSEVVNQTYEGRPQTDLVVRMISTIGNYDYILDWVFTQAGEIKVMVGATGMDAGKGVLAQTMSDPIAMDDTAFGTLVAPGVVAVNHDHFFSFRLDLDVDGQANRFVKDLIKTEELPRDNPRRSLWTTESVTLLTDSEAKLDLSYDRPGRWRVLSSEAKNHVGNPTSYQIVPMGNQSNLLLPEDYPTRRAAFVKHHLWVTPYNPDEIYAAGKYPNQSKGEDGLSEWTSHQRSLMDTDLVAWNTLGFHHVTVSEDWPIMPTTWHGFMLKPVNFFDRNPALDIPNLQRFSQR